MSDATEQNERIGYLLDQASIARDYARARPASDLNGFFAALRDAEQFEAEAAAIAKAISQ